jgi:hypothetical protein
MRRLLKDLRTDKQGVTMIEYALIAGLISVWSSRSSSPNGQATVASVTHRFKASGKTRRREMCGAKYPYD